MSKLAYIFVFNAVCSSVLFSFRTKVEFLDMYNTNIVGFSPKAQKGLAHIKQRIMAGTISVADMKNFYFAFCNDTPTINHLRTIAVSILYPKRRKTPPSDMVIALAMMQRIMLIAKEPYKGALSDPYYISL